MLLPKVNKSINTKLVNSNKNNNNISELLINNTSSIKINTFKKIIKSYIWYDNNLILLIYTNTYKYVYIYNIKYMQNLYEINEKYKCNNTILTS